MQLSLIIPCYNEAQNLPLLLERCKLLTLNTPHEIILVDNGSTDNSTNILNTILPHYKGCRTVRVDTNQGYGHGILTGLYAARGDILGWTHADLQTDPKDVMQALPLFTELNTDLFVKGRRYGRPFLDTLFTMGMSCFETLLFHRPMWDINAQPTLFSRSFFESWQDPPTDFALDLYAYQQALYQHLPIYRFPVHFSKRIHGISHWNIDWSSKYRFIRRTLEFSLQLRREMKIKRNKS